MGRARPPQSNWAGNPTVALPGPIPQAKPQPPAAPPSKAKSAPPPKKSDADETPPELKILQSALDRTTEECKRLTTELEGRQEVHEKALQAKEEALRAAEDKITRIERELSEAKSLAGKSGDDTYEHLISERDNFEVVCRCLQEELDFARNEELDLAEVCDALRTELEMEKAKAAQLQQQLNDLTQKLNNLQAETKGKKLIDAQQYQFLAQILAELKDLDPEGIGVDEKIVKRISKKINDLSTALSQAQADLASAGTDVPDHSACQAEIDRLNQRCVELERINVHALGEKSTAEQSAADLQQQLQEAYDRASREETRANDLESQLSTAAQACDQAKAIEDEAEKMLVKLDPDPDGPLEERVERIIARLEVDTPKNSSSPKQAFKEPLVLLVMVGLVLASLFGMYEFMSYRARLAAPAGSPSASVPEELLGDAQPEPAGSTVHNTVGAPATVPETCYAVNEKVISLFFGQDLKDGKVFGHVPSLKPGQKRIKCDEEPSYDEKNKQTDISACKACIPFQPGVYNATDLMGSIIPQSDATCYVEPTNYKFHNWPRGKSIRFDCSKGAPYDAVRNCRDVSGCSIIIPDPTVE